MSTSLLRDGRPAEVRMCRHCGAEFTARRSRKTRFCSNRCSWLAQNAHLTVARRLSERVDRSGGPDACWLWRGALHPNGYGTLGIEGRTRYAHRAAWEASHGGIPSGLSVLHRCDNPPCVNPSHLFLGTQSDNMADKAAKGRGPRGETNPQARLTVAEVLAIRELRGLASPTEIASRFGIRRAHVFRIFNRERWSHV